MEMCECVWEHTHCLGTSKHLCGSEEEIKEALNASHVWECVGTVRSREQMKTCFLLSFVSCSLTQIVVHCSYHEDCTQWFLWWMEYSIVFEVLTGGLRLYEHLHSHKIKPRKPHLSVHLSFVGEIII